MTCDDCTLLLAANALVGVDDHGAELRVHLRECRQCRAVAAAQWRASDLLPLTLEPVRPRAELRSRLLAQVHADVAGERRDPLRPPRRSWGVRLWRAVPSARGLTLSGGFAAIAVAGLAGWAVFAQHTPAAEPALVSHACGLIPLPSACGELSYAPARHQAVLTVRDLPAPPVVNDQPTGIYEVWLIRPNGSAQPVAYLSRPPGARNWTAVIEGDIAGSVTVATTRESDPGHPVPSGPELLAIATPHLPAGR